MATEQIILGTKLKRNINIQPVDGITMDSYYFQVEFISDPLSPKRVIIEKGEAKRVDSNNYIVPIDTSLLSVGRLICYVTAHIPDDDFSDGVRVEIVEVDTGVELVKKP